MTYNRLVTVQNYILDNREPESALVRFLCKRLPASIIIRFAVAFAKISGWQLLADSVMTAIDGAADVELLIGLDLRITDAALVRDLVELSEVEPKFRLYCFCDPSVDDVPFYHPKVYILDGFDCSFVSVGSSNLTSGGLRDNIEMNLAFEGPKDDEFILDLRGLYPLVKGRGRPFAPTHEFVSSYEEIAARSRQARTRSKEVEVASSLKELSETMPRVSLSADELVGWQRLVFDRLPDEEFRTRDMYEYEKELGALYPQNKHVRAKLRQVLQQLRDMGLLEHVRESVWRRS